MGICLAYTTASDETIDRIMAEPKLLLKLLDAEDALEYATTRTGLGKWLFGRKRSEPAQLDLAEGEGVEGDLDKAWHGIHFLLTGSEDVVDGPLGFLNYGGDVIEGVDVGYGPPVALRSTALKAAHAALADLSDEQLRGRFDPEAMMEAGVYPEVWDRGEEELDYLMEFVPQLREDLAESVRTGMGWIVSYC